MSRPVLVWVVVGWVGSLALFVLLLWPGAIPSATRDLGVVGHPLLVRILLLWLTAYLAGSSVLIILIRQSMRTRLTPLDIVFREIVIGFATGAPAWASFGHFSPPLWNAYVAGGAFVVAEVLIHVMLGWSNLATFASGLLATVTWVPLILLEAEHWTDIGGWEWVLLVPLGQAIAAVTVSYAIVRGSQSRVKLVPAIYRDDISPRIVFAIVVAAAILVTLRRTVIPPIGQADSIWRADEGWPVWILSAIVAAIIARLAIRSSREPLLKSSTKGLIFALALAANFPQLAFTLFGAALMSPGDPVASSIKPIIYSVPVLLVGEFVLGSLILVVGLVRFGRSGTQIKWAAIIGLLAIPTWVVAQAAGTSTEPLPQPLPVAGPPEVTTCLVAIALVLAVWNVISPGRFSSSSVVRLAVVPIVAVSFLIDVGLPETVGRVVVVAGVLSTFFWLMPPVAADQRRHDSNVLLATGGQLLALMLCAAITLDVQWYTVQNSVLWLFGIVVLLLVVDTKPVVNSSIR